MVDVAGEIADIAETWPPGLADLFQKVLRNVLSAPQDVKFRRLRLTNGRIASLLEAPGVMCALEALGWQRNEEDGVLELPTNADLARVESVLERIAASQATCLVGSGAEAGELVCITVMRGPLRTKIELPASATLKALAAAIEQHPSLGRIPRYRQRLLAGYPPKPIQEASGSSTGEAATLAKLGLKTVVLEDLWEQLVSDLRGGRASFVQLAEVFRRPVLAQLALRENRDFILDRACSMLKSQSSSAVPSEELQAARTCVQKLWFSADASTCLDRIKFCAESLSPAGSGAPRPPPQGESLLADLVRAAREEEEEPPARFVLEIERSNLFRSAITQVARASLRELHAPLEVRFLGEAAQDAGGLRREFFNEFARAAAKEEGLWLMTPAGSLLPAPAALARRAVPEDSARRALYRGSGRVFGMALCQAALPPAQPLLLGLPLAKSFVRAVQCDFPESIEDLQAELNVEQHEAAPDFRGSPAFLQQPLAQSGLEGQLTFAASSPDGSLVDLVPNGRDRTVTNETKNEWLRATLRYELCESVEEAAAAFRAGFCELVGLSHLVLLSATELREAWSGHGEITDADLRAWQQRTEVSPAVKQQADWLFELLWGDLQGARARLLKFTTGSDRWPLNADGFRFVIEPMDGGDEVLPCAMTCGNMLQLPRYSSKEPLRARLLQAMDWGIDLHLA